METVIGIVVIAIILLIVLATDTYGQKLDDEGIEDVGHWVSSEEYKKQQRRVQ